MSATRSLARYGLMAIAIGVAIALPPHWKQGRAQENPAATVEKTAPETSPVAAPSSLPKTSVSPDATLIGTAPYLGTPTPEQILPLGQELSARGQPQIARRVFDALSTTDADYERLTRKLLQLGTMEAADELLQAWERKSPRNPQAQLLRATFYQANGQADLALRELLGVAAIPPEQRPLVDLQRQLLQMEQSGVLPSSEANPWGVEFVGPSGKYEAGRIAEDQAKKIPPGTTDAFLQLIALVPKQGNLWALLGELLNASGNPRAALECLVRAERPLLYSSRVSREHRRVLEEHQRAVEREMNQSVGALAGGASEAPAAEQEIAKPGWSNLATRPQVLAVIVVGAAFILLILILQLREWRKAVRKRQ